MLTALMSTTGKLVASVAVLGSAAAVAGLGTFGTFTSTTSATSAVSSSTVQIALGANGAATNRLNLAASAIVPGDIIQRSVDLSNTGTADLSSITLTTGATVSSLLDTNTTLGLQLSVDKCSTGWTENGSSPAFTYTCGGTLTPLLSSVPVIQTNQTLSTLSALTAGGTDHLRVTMTLPALATNLLQNQSSSIGFSFTGTQRTSTNK